MKRKKMKKRIKWLEEEVEFQRVQMLSLQDSCRQHQEAWRLLYGLMIDLISGEDESSAGNPRVVALADEIEMDPVTAIAIITATSQAIRWWRKRDGELPRAKNPD